MKIRELKQWIWLKRIVGGLASLVAIYLLVLSWLTGLWLTLQVSQGTRGTRGLAENLSDLVARVYHWIHFDSPLNRFIVPLNFDDFFSRGNLGFLLIYLLLLAGGLVLASANGQARMLRDALARRRQRELDRALDGHQAPQRSTDDREVELPDMRPLALAKHIYIMYLVPVIVVVLGAVIVHWLGMG